MKTLHSEVCFVLFDKKLGKYLGQEEGILFLTPHIKHAFCIKDEIEMDEVIEEYNLDRQDFLIVQIQKIINQIDK